MGGKYGRVSDFYSFFGGLNPGFLLLAVSYLIFLMAQ
jgi:hypothetical protein